MRHEDGATGQAIDYLLAYTAGHRDEVLHAAGQLARIVAHIYPGGLETPVVAAMLGLAVSRAVALQQPCTDDPAEPPEHEHRPLTQ